MILIFFMVVFCMYTCLFLYLFSLCNTLQQAFSTILLPVPEFMFKFCSLMKIQGSSTPMRFRKPPSLVFPKRWKNLRSRYRINQNLYGKMRFLVPRLFPELFPALCACFNETRDSFGDCRIRNALKSITISRSC